MCLKYFIALGMPLNIYSDNEFSFLRANNKHKLIFDTIDTNNDNISKQLKN